MGNNNKPKLITIIKMKKVLLLGWIPLLLASYTPLLATPHTVPDSTVSRSQVQVSKEKSIGNKNFRIGVKGGWSYLIAKTSKEVPNDFKNYMKELKSGYHFGGDLGYY